MHSDLLAPADYKLLLDGLTSSVLLLDEQLQVEYANPAAEMLLDSSARQLAGSSILSVLFLAEGDRQLLLDTLASGHPFTQREAKLSLSSGRELTVDYSVTPFLQGPSRLLLELQARDRLLRIEREEELLERHATTRTLVRGMAHEIKNPLGGIRGAAQLLERELTDPSLEEFTKVIIDEADRLRDLVDRLLGPRKLPAFSPLNIHSVLERVCSLVQAEAGDSLLLVKDYDPSLPELPGDESQLIQALLNVVRNALEALQEAGVSEPRITLRSRASRQITIGPKKHRLACLVEVIDNGVGIDPQLLNHLFFPMVSGRAQGSGLGLSIAQSIVNQHGGLIECSSAPGNTCFSIYLPICS